MGIGMGMGIGVVLCGRGGFVLGGGVAGVVLVGVDVVLMTVDVVLVAVDAVLVHVPPSQGRGTEGVRRREG